MPRNKDKGVDFDIQLNRRARQAGRLGIRDTKEVTLPIRSTALKSEPLSPPPLPPKMPYAEMKRILSERKRLWVEAGLVPLPAEEEGSEFAPPKTTSLADYQQIQQMPAGMYDPVIKQWKMYMNANPNTHVMLLLYPDKWPGELYNVKTAQKPIEMRIKTNFNLVEVDIPIDPFGKSFDKIRGIIYGEALRKSQVLKEKGGSYGVAGGFGIDNSNEGGSKKGSKKRGSKKRGAAASASRPASEVGPTVEALLADYDNAVKGGHVMDKITLGGKISPWSEDSPNWFVGYFEKCKRYRKLLLVRVILIEVANVFFTKVDAICALRPQLLHIDALNDLSKSTSRVQAGADKEKTAAKSTSRMQAGSDTEEKTAAKSTLRMQAGADTEENTAVSVNMTIKKSDGERTEDAPDPGEIAKLLKAMRAEPWQRLAWVDKDVSSRGISTA